jgi:hypothetical protein
MGLSFVFKTWRLSGPMTGLVAVVLLGPNANILLGTTNWMES